MTLFERLTKKAQEHPQRLVLPGIERTPHS